LFGTLYTLGSNGNSKLIRKSEDSPDNDSTIIVFTEPIDKSAIDFNPIKLEVKQLRKRGITCAEVLQCNVHPALTELADECLADFSRFTEGRLGEFQLKLVRAQSGVG